MKYTSMCKRNLLTVWIYYIDILEEIEFICEMFSDEIEETKHFTKKFWILSHQLRKMILRIHNLAL